MKLAYLSDVTSATIHDIKFLEEFAKHFDLHVISFSHENVIWNKSPVHHIPAGKFSFYLQWRKLREIIDDIKPDVIFANYLTKYPVLLYLAHAKYPTISVGWGSDVIYQSAFPPFSFLIKKVCEKSCAIIVDSQYCKNILQKFSCSKIKVIPFGVDINFFRRDDRRKKVRTMEELNEKLVVISPRNHYKLYNIETVIKSARYFHEDVFLLIAGQGRRTEKLKKMARKYNLKNVKFLGFLPREKIAEYFSASDVIISIPLWDSTSVSLLEGMASYCVPIVSDLPANREWVKDEKNGFIVKPKDYRKIAEIVNKLAENRELLKNMGEMNRKIIEERADWRKNSKDFLKVIQECSKP